MKCPNDQTEMEKGSLNTHGSRWIKAGMRSGFLNMVSAGGGDIVIAYKCPKCGKIELYSDPESA